MPVLDVTIPEVTKQCTEVIAEQTVNRLLTYLNIHNLFINNDNLFLKSDDIRSSNFDDSNNNVRAQNNRCDVEITPGYSPIDTKFDILRSKVTSPHQYSLRHVMTDYPVFCDKRSLVSLFEITVPNTIELKFSIKVKSVELADAIHTSLYSRYLIGNAVADNSIIQFSYGIPDNILLLLYKIYKMQDDVISEMTFKDYLTIGSNSGITAVSNRDRLDDIEIVMQRFNSQVFGIMDYNGDKHDTEDFNKVSNRYVIEFTYVLQWSKPMMFRMVYPIMVYNKIIDNQFIGQPPYNMSIGEGEQYIKDIGINSYYLKQNKDKYHLGTTYPLIKSHYYDDWQRSATMYKEVNDTYQMLFIGVAQLTVNDDESLSLSIDLENEVFPMLGSTLVSEIKYLLSDEIYDESGFDTNEYIFRRMSIFDISMFSNDNMIDYHKLSIDENYVLTVSGNFDITKIYRLVISQIKDLRKINRQYIYYMLNNPTYYQELISVNMQYLITTGYLKVISNIFTNEKVIELEKMKIQTQSWLRRNDSIIVNNYILKIMY